jgi:hypothetical protein
MRNLFSKKQARINQLILKEVIFSDSHKMHINSAMVRA